MSLVMGEGYGGCIHNMIWRLQVVGFGHSQEDFYIIYSSSYAAEADNVTPGYTKIKYLLCFRSRTFPVAVISVVHSSFKIGIWQDITSEA
jgi:hypothetical protein